MGRLWVGPKTGMGFCTRLRGHKRRGGRDPAAARFFVAGPPQKKEGDGTGDDKGRAYGGKRMRVER